MVWCSYPSPQPYSKFYIFKQKIVTFGEIFYQWTQPAPGILHHCSCWALQMAKFPMEIWISGRQRGRHPPLFPHITPGQWEFSVTEPSYSSGRDAQMAPKTSGVRERDFYSHFSHDADVEPTNNICLQNPLQTKLQTASEPTPVVGTGGREGSDGHSSILLSCGIV